jgi:hypothetical protein
LNAVSPCDTRSSRSATSDDTSNCASERVFIKNTSPRSATGTCRLNIDGCMQSSAPPRHTSAPRRYQSFSLMRRFVDRGLAITDAVDPTESNASTRFCVAQLDAHRRKICEVKTRVRQATGRSSCTPRTANVLAVCLRLRSDTIVHER